MREPNRRLLGLTWRGWLNFLVLQWFFVRLASFDYKKISVHSGTSSISNCVAGGDIICVSSPVTTVVDKTGWKIERWVWPMTGWFSRLRYVTFWR